MHVSLPPNRHQVFIQTKKYASAKVREVNTRDSTGSLTVATDRKLDLPENVGMACPWEPRDSAIGPGKLFLNGVIEGGPEYAEFGPDELDAFGEPVPKLWMINLRGTWKEIQDHYSDQGFTADRIMEWDQFFSAYPWDGLKDLSLELRPPYRDPVFQDGPSDSHASEEVKAMLSTAGQDPQGRPRLFYSVDGRDLMDYPRVMSRVTYGNTYLDGTSHMPKKRKRRGRCPHTTPKRL